MLTDGLTDRQEAGNGEGVEVLDVAQLLLGAIDTNTVQLPPKRKPEPAAKAATATAPTATPAKAPAAPTGDGAAHKKAEPVTGLGIAGGAKRPGAKKAVPAPAAEKPAAATEAPAPAEPAKAQPVKGLGIAAGAKRPGAKKAAPTAEKPDHAGEPTVVQPPDADLGKAEPVETAPVKGVGIAAGATVSTLSKMTDVVARPAGSMTDTRELEAKMAYDQAFAILAAQRTDLQQMQSKAKDLIGLLTLAATFLGAFGHANAGAVLNSVKAHPVWVIVMFLIFPVFTAIAAIYVMTPRDKWIFNLNAASVRDDMKKRDPTVVFRSAEAFYLAYVAKLTEFQQRNAGKLKTRKWALWAATASLLIAIAFTGILVMTTTPGTK